MRYEKKHDAFIREIARDCHSYEELTDLFNERFGTKQSLSSLQQHSVKTLAVYLVTEQTEKRFSDEEKQWLKNQFCSANGYADLTARFNARFGKNKTISAISDQCAKRLGLKGMKNVTRFGEVRRKEQLPVGTVHVCSNGTTYIKARLLEDVFNFTGYAEPYWLPIQKKVWQEHYGEVPKGKMVIFLDGNHENIDINNLYCIDRKISAVLARNRWYTGSREHTLTAIKWCELFYALHGRVPKKNERNQDDE